MGYLKIISDGDLATTKNIDMETNTEKKGVKSVRFGGDGHQKSYAYIEFENVSLNTRAINYDSNS